MAAMDWRRAVRLRDWAMRIVVTRREVVKVIGRDPIAMSLQKIVAAVVCHADACLVTAFVADDKGFSAAVDRRDSHGFGVVLLRIGCTVDASYYGDAPVRGAPNTIQIDHF
jgi:hypothetical protein